MGVTDNTDLLARLDEMHQTATAPEWRHGKDSLFGDAATALRVADAEVARLTDERDELLDQVSEQEGLTDKYHSAITAALAEMNWRHIDTPYGHSMATVERILTAALPAPAALSDEFNVHPWHPGDSMKGPAFGAMIYKDTK